MNFEDLSPLAKRILALNEKQRKIILNIMQTIKDCEGGISETFWCNHCMVRAERCSELLVRFEKINIRKKKESYDTTARYYFGGDFTPPPEYEN